MVRLESSNGTAEIVLRVAKKLIGETAGKILIKQTEKL